MATQVSSFIVVEDNEDGWGPSSSTVPEKFKDVPYYAPYNKGDKLGKAADWQQQQYQKSKGGYNQKEREGGNSMFQFFANDDDSSFTIVDSTKTQTKSRFGAKRFQKGYQNMRPFRGPAAQSAWAQNNTGAGRGGKQVPRKHQNLPNRWSQQTITTRKFGEAKRRDASVQVKESWTLVEDIEFTKLNRLAIDAEPQPEDLKKCGSLESYDKTYDRVTSRTERVLEKSDRVFFSVTTSEDPIIKQFASENVGEVYATDAILKYLMVCTRSIYPWDVLVHREGDRLYLDKRDKSQFDFLTVNETSQEPPEDVKENPNNPVNLGKEATWINQLFSQQVLVKSDKPTVEYDPNPFQQEGEKVSATAYRYRKWELGDYTLVARTEIDGILGENLLTIKCQNEFDPRIQGDWRKTIDAQKGSILATELKNNSYKLAQWTIQALLAGTDNIKLGYVSRAVPKDPTNHIILGSQDYKPKEFAQQISLNMKNAWAVLNYIIEKCMAQPAGEYILMRDPERNVLKLFALPPGEVIKGTE